MQESSRYTICEEIASGSTATVYLAEDAVLRRKVALKKLHPHLLNHPETVRRFEKEALAVASLSHENIIRVYDFGNQERNQYLAMEYVDGSPLERLLADAGGPLPNRVCLSILRQLLSGLAAAHDAGIVHRDIKPSNLLVDRKGRIRIADFGIAFLAEEKNITKTGSYLGTPVYSAPEQARGLPATDRSDMFSSGVLFYRCLTGRLPFDGGNSHAILAAILDKVPVKPVQINRRILPGLSELAERMLSKDPARRPSARECLQALQGVAERHALAIEDERLRLYLEDPKGRTEGEEADLSAHFRALAAQAELDGNPRMAVKLAAQADLHGAPMPASPLPAPEAPEAGVPGTKWRVPVLAGLAGVSLLAAFIPFLRDPGNPAPGAAAASRTAAHRIVPAAPANPAPVPTVPAALPVTPPAAAAARVAPARRAAPKARKPAPGFLLAKTNPPFVRILLGGQALGVTPLKSALELPAGEHDVTFEREGCLPRTERIRILPGETATLRVVLDPAQAEDP